MQPANSLRRRSHATRLAALLVLGWVGSAAAATTASGPTIRLFPTTVLEDIRHTGQVAKEMESGLQRVIGQLDQQQQLFLEAKCDGAEEDPGCDMIARQLGATYLEMLNIMSERLPDMERAVQSTRASLETHAGLLVVRGLGVDPELADVGDLVPVGNGRLRHRRLAVR